jgi:hypothetical protein
MFPWVSNKKTYSDLVRGPRVEVDRLDFGNVDAEIPVDPGAADAHEDAQVPRRPSWTWKAMDPRMKFPKNEQVPRVIM